MLQDSAVQATSEPLRRNCSEYEPRELTADERDAILASPGFTDFLARIRPRCKTPVLHSVHCVFVSLRLVPLRFSVHHDETLRAWSLPP